RGNSKSPAKTAKSELWAGPGDEDAIFARAKELWRNFRMSISPLKPCKFDKESFERAVFGVNAPSARTAFEKAVFGQPQEWTDEDDDDKTDNEEERRIKSGVRLTRYPTTPHR